MKAALNNQLGQAEDTSLSPSGRPDVLDINQLNITDGRVLHSLCNVCKEIQFDRSTFFHCDNTFCVDRLFSDSPPDVSKHTKPVPHHSNMAALEASAIGYGCHLCAIILSCLRNSDAVDLFGVHDVPPRGEGLPTSEAPVEVQLTYAKDEQHDLEQITVHCAGSYGRLELTDLPESNCTDSPDLRAEDNVLFVTLTTSSSKEIKNQGKSSSSSTNLELSRANAAYSVEADYEAGQILRVYEEKDGFWLASVARDVEHRKAWVRAGNHPKLLHPPHQGCCCGKGLWEPPLLRNAETAYLDENSASPEVFSQIKRWLDDCKLNHTECRTQKNTKLPYRVLDVGPPDGSVEPFLSIGKNRQGEFLTLSYRWGTTTTLTTTKSEVSSFTKSIPIKSLPNTIGDAVTVTRRLGYQFLWVDALCIIQDSIADWSEQSKLMGQIYGDAVLNIAADSADDVADGFLKDRSLHQIRSCRHPSLFGDGSPTKAICPSLLFTRRAVARGSLAKRGWILQERALSKRIIHWTESEIAWECRVFQASERVPWGNEWTSPSYHEMMLGTRIDGGFRAGQKPKSRYDGVRIAVQSNPPVIDTADQSSKHIDYSSWYDLVEDYSGRQLTRPSDKMMAVHSLAETFEKSRGLHGKYMAGFWRTDTIRGLIWRVNWPEPVEPSLRDKSIPPGKHSRLKGLAQYRVPSFSWASVDQEVSFENNEKLHIAYEAQMLGADVIDRRSDVSEAGTYGNRIHLYGLARKLNSITEDQRWFWHDQQEIENELDVLESELVVFWLKFGTSKKIVESDDEEERGGDEEKATEEVDVRQEEVVGDQESKDGHDWQHRTKYQTAVPGSKCQEQEHIDTLKSQEEDKDGDSNSARGSNDRERSANASDEGDQKGEGNDQQNEMVQYCLVLHPYGVDGEYYRVGLYVRDEWEGPDDFDGWEEMMVKII